MTNRSANRPYNDHARLREAVYSECHDAIMRRNPGALNGFREKYREALAECDEWWNARITLSTHNWLRTFGVYLPSKRSLIPIRRCTRGPQTPPRRKRNT